MKRSYENDSKRIAKNSLALYVRMLLKTGIALYVSRIVLEALGVEDYGIYNIVGGVVIVFSFLNRSIAASTERFLTFEIGRKDFEQLKKVFCLSVSIHMGAAILIFGLLETLGLYFLEYYINIPATRMNAAKLVFHCSVFTSMFSMLQAPYNAVIIANERMNIYAYISIWEVLLNLFIALLLLHIPSNRLEWYGFSLLLSAAIITSCYFIYCRWKFKECRWNFVWDFFLFKKLLGFTGWNICGALSWVGRSQGVNIILNSFYGPCLNAAYGISMQVNNALELFVQSFIAALNPPIVKRYSSGNIDGMKKMIFEGARYSFFLLFLLTLPMLLEMNTILSLWLKEVPEYTLIFTRLAIIGSIFSTLGNTMQSGIFATGKIKKLQIIIITLSALNLIAAYILLAIGFPPFTIMLTVVFIAILSLFGRLFILYQLLEIPKQDFMSEIMQLFKRITLVSIIAIIGPLFLEVLLTDDSIWKFVIIVSCSMISVSLSTFWFGLTKNERFYLLKIIQDKIYKKHI